MSPSSVSSACPLCANPEIFQELQRREQLGDHGFHHSLVVDREKGAQAVDYGFDRCLADRCEPVPQQLFVFVGRLYDVQPVGDPKQSDRQYLLPVYQLLEIQHGMRIAQFGDQLLGFERRSKISGLPGRSLDRADCGLEPRFVVFRKEVAMFRGQFAGQVIQVGGPVDAAPALGEGGGIEAIPSNSRNNFFMWFLGLGLSVQFSDYFSIPCCKPPLNLQPSPGLGPSLKRGKSPRVAARRDFLTNGWIVPCYSTLKPATSSMLLGKI